MQTRTQQEFPKKWVGVVMVKTAEMTVKFTSVEKVKDANGKETVKPFPNGELDMKVKLADLPKIGKRVIKPHMDGKTFRIRLNEDGDEVEEVGPVSGTFKAKLIELGPKKKDAECATPYVKYFNKGKDNENSHLEFFGVYEISEGVFKGLKLPAYRLHYKFEGIPEGEEGEGLTRFDTVDNAQASQLHRLQAWGKTHGDIFEEPIAWEVSGEEDISEDVLDCFANKYSKKNYSTDFANILAVLEERILDADVDVSVTVENGYPNVIQAFESYEEGSDEDDDELEKDFPPVKSKAKETPKTVKRVKHVEEDDEEEL